MIGREEPARSWESVLGGSNEGSRHSWISADSTMTMMMGQGALTNTALEQMCRPEEGGERTMACR
jgi:hypothetical protein